MSTNPARLPVPLSARRAVSVVHRPGLAVVVAVGASLVMLAALRLLWLSRHWPLVHDAPLMHYAAWRILEGAAPYRDVFDMNFPGVYLVHLLLLAILGPGDLAFRALDLGLLVAACGGIWAGLRSISPFGALAAMGLFALYHVAGGPWLAGQRDLMLCPFLAWGVAGALASVGATERARIGWLGGAALALGAGAWIKPHTVVLFPALLGWAWWTGRGPARRREAVAVGAGLALPAVAAFAWLAWTASLGAFMDITLQYLLPLYSRLGRSDLLHDLAVRDYGRGVLAGLGAWAGLGALALARGRRWSGLGVLAVGVAYGVAHFWVQGRGWEYQFYPLVLFLTALGGAGLGAAAADGRRVFTLTLLLALTVTASELWTKGERNLAPAWIQAKMARVDRVSAVLRPVVAAGGRVQVLDTSEGGIHALFRLHARQPSRFLYDFHFYHDVGHPYVQGLRVELMDALRNRPPAAIVVFVPGWPRGGYERLAQFADLQRWLLEGYRLAEEGDGYRLYIQRAGIP